MVTAGPHGFVEGAAPAPLTGGIGTARPSSGLVFLCMTGSRGSAVLPLSVFDAVLSGRRWTEGTASAPHSPTRSALARQPSRCAVLSTESYFTGKRPKEASGGSVCRLRRLPTRGDAVIWLACSLFSERLYRGMHIQSTVCYRVCSLVSFDTFTPMTSSLQSKYRSPQKFPCVPSSLPLRSPGPLPGKRRSASCRSGTVCIPWSSRHLTSHHMHSFLLAGFSHSA